MLERRRSAAVYAVAGLFVFSWYGNLLAAAEIRLTDEGRPTAAIILSSARKPNDPSFKALVSWIKRMSGAELPVLRESDLAGAKIENGKLVAPAGRTIAEN